jgi:hypothetical protein
MDDARGPFSIERAWNAVDGWPVCRIVWTMAPLRQIGPAVEAGDQPFLATLDQAVRQALETTLTRQTGEGDLQDLQHGSWPKPNKDTGGEFRIQHNSCSVGA